MLVIQQIIYMPTRQANINISQEKMNTKNTLTEKKKNTKRLDNLKKSQIQILSSRHLYPNKVQ